MAIAKTEKLIVDKVPELVRKEVLPAPKPITTDTKYEARSSLLQYISGSSWRVTYYKQIKTHEEASEAFNINRPAPYQQYKKIENFEIRVTSPLSNSPDNEKSTLSIQGVGLIYPSIIPDHGDTFVADIGDGRMGVFNVFEVTQKSHLKDTVYEIEYHIVAWLDHELLKELDEKVVSNAYYERSYSDYGANPVLNEEEHGLFNKITKWQSMIVRHYFDSFFSAEYRTFLVPLPGMVVYDPFIVEFIRRIWSSQDIPELRHLKVYNRDNNTNHFMRTIWDSIIDNDVYSIARAKTKFGMIPKRLFKTGAPGLMALQYSRLDYVYHPIHYIDERCGIIEIPNIGKANFTEHFSEFSTPRELTIKITKLPGLGFVHPDLHQFVPAPDAKRYGTFDTYLLSEAFYKNDRKNMSVIEKILMDIFEEKDTDAKAFIDVMNQVINWGEVERFYYIPLLYAMSRAILGGLTR